jgi:hypothetical protein
MMKDESFGVLRARAYNLYMTPRTGDCKESFGINHSWNQITIHIKQLDGKNGRLVYTALCASFWW